ncbi:MAG: MFS transporter [Flammeovirgaceae bacterium]|jgi:dipeptide/tripeptide permease|nr:MFS transporter [Flammeovirgaceae bacterium]
MNLSQRWHEARHGFSSTFWIANTLELFERLAFYGTKAVLAFFLAKKVGLEDEAGALVGTFFTGVIFFLPIFTGVLVDKYGFKKTLIACFAVFASGYFLIALAGMEWGNELVANIGAKNYIIAVLVFTAAGGSLIKPCIVGTVAKTTTEGSRALGFSIYYSLVNLGGSVAPIIAYYIRQDLGIEFVLVMSSITSLLLMVGTIFFFKEPSSGNDIKEERSLGKVFSDMITVFSNFKFISFLIIFSGFWIIFWQIFLLLPFYATDVLGYEKFEFLESVDAFFVIVFSPLLAILFKNWKAFTAMIVGFLLASLAWIIVGAFPTVLAVVIGVAVFAFGEATQAPRFYEYVSNLAPTGQVGTYMGFAFLPVALGSVMAGYLADWLRNSYMETSPSTMWYILSGIGLFSTLLMIVYDKLAVKKTG